MQQAGDVEPGGPADIEYEFSEDDELVDGGPPEFEVDEEEDLEEDMEFGEDWDEEDDLNVSR